MAPLGLQAHLPAARSWLRDAQVPLTWPRFTSPRSGLVIDFKDGVFRRGTAAWSPISGRSGSST
jgi:hypothetical protein